MAAKIETIDIYTPRKRMLFCKARRCHNGEIIFEIKGRRNLDTISLRQLIMELEKNGFPMDEYRYKI